MIYTPEQIRSNWIKFNDLFLKQNCSYNQSEQEIAEQGKRFMLPVDEKYELMNLRKPDHGKKVEENY